MASVADKKSQASRHKRENIKRLKKKISDSEKLVKSMPSKTMKQRQARDAEKNKMNSYLMDQASMLKTIPYNWYIMKAYAEAGLPYISDVAKDYVEKYDENDQPIGKTKKVATPKKTVKRATTRKVSKPKVSTKKADVPKAKAPVVKTKKNKKARTGTPPLLAKVEAKKLEFSSAEAKLTYYYKKLRKERLAKVKKMYTEPDRIKVEMDYFDEDYGPKGSNWSKNVKKLATAERQIKKLRRLYIAFWKMGFDEKMLLHQFRVHEMEDHPKARHHGNSQEAIYKRLGEEEIIPRNKLINEMSEILQEIREGENLEKFIESIESIEVLNEEKLSSIMLDDEDTKEAYIKLRTSLVETLFKIYQIYRKNLGSYDGGIVDWLGRSDDKIYKLKDRTIVKLTYELFDDYIFDKYTPF